MSKIEVNAIEPQCGTTLTVGASGDTITFPTGTTIVNNGTQTGFGRTGTVDWQTTPKTATFTAVSGEGYFANTSGGALTVTLPASPSGGDIVSIADYTRTFTTNNCTIGRNSEPIGGIAEDAILNVNGQSATFVYVDGTEGWINVQETQTSQTGAVNFLAATGGTITCCGDYKIHTFTGPGTFCVSQISSICSSRNLVSYMVVAGGGSGGRDGGGGGGAGGYRSAGYGPSPLQGSALPITVTGYPITVGGGAASVPGGASPALGSVGLQGSNSVFSTIASAGGGGGNSCDGGVPSAKNGGSGGGAAGPNSPGNNAGAGNTPPTNPPQGNNGGGGGSGCGGYNRAGGGGGATAVGSNGTGSNGGTGGAGAPNAITGSAISYVGGGGGAGYDTGPTVGGNGGAGGGGPAGRAPNASGQPDGSGNPGTVNTGGGGGGSMQASGLPSSATPSGAGGSGIVIIRYKFQ